MTERILPRFGTILAARGNDSRPSDLEFLLRSHCDKIRVVKRLHGDAHLLLPKVGSTSSSLAIRVYEETEESLDSTQGDDDASMDTFFDSFQMAVIFFILPAQQVLDDIHSPFHRAQRLAMRATRQSVNSNKGGKTSGDKLMTRACLVPNASTALSILFSIIDAIQKREIRSLYFQRQQTRFFSPRLVQVGGADDDGHPSTSTPATTKMRMIMIPESCRPHAAIHIAETLRSWAHRFDLPPGEVNVLMSVLGSLTTIATTPPAHGLDMVPVEDRTKRLLQAFFGISS